MTLDEAIKHCEEVAEEYQASIDSLDIVGKGLDECEECAKEHRQLAEWLKELKAIKEVIDNQGDTNNAWIFLEKIEDILYPINEITYDNKGEVKADDKKEV